MDTKKICMNAACGATTSVEWKKGWDLRSGGFATLCYNCGYAYENLAFCDTFHLEETGWRECSLCKKRLHCGCIASKAVLELLEFGGVECSSCARSYQPNQIWRCQDPKHIDTSTLYNDVNARPTSAANTVDADNSVNTEKLFHLGSDIVSKEMLLHLGSDTVSKENILHWGSDTVSKETLFHLGSDTVSKEKNLHIGNFMETIESSHFPKFPQPPKGDKNLSNDMIKKEDFRSPIRELGGFLSLIQPSVESSKNSISNNIIPLLGDKDMYETLRKPSMSVALTSPSGSPNFKPTFLSGVVNEREQNKTHSSFQQGQRSRLILPKPSKLPPIVSLDATKGTSSQVRVARPPGEGRGGNQLLPRYWPRITDDELRKLSGELKSTVVPLFEKVLSASDAGRIGRLVLPKACAEAYFPTIIQSEGLPIRIQDAKGNEWIFQFRFWPNNNSRMYVLEGVTPCIQSMQLEAGDTVTFSRIDPGGKLVIGSRKATGIVDMQDGETSALPNGTIPGEMPNSSAPTINGFTGLFKSPKEFKDPPHNTPGYHLNVVDENVSWPRKDTLGKMKPRNIIGSKIKRLLMDSDDVMELRFTWEESQDLLRPPPRVKPNIVSIEDHEIEEYDEPPVFGKKTIFTMQPSGEQEQWGQCDNCFKWRRLPLDFLLPSKWTCLDNVWDPNRCSCSAPDDMGPKEVKNVFKPTKDFKRRRTAESHNVVQDHMSCGLDALASAAILGEESVSDEGDGLTGVTTKHPRHRPGCSCIVCIQPPSGKGKHKSTCACNVCLTMKRRSETQMLRRKIRQSEREAEVAQKDELEMNDASNELLSAIQPEADQPGNGQIDLNFQPYHHVDVQHEATYHHVVQVAGHSEGVQHEVANGVSIMNPVQVTSFPLETCLKQNRLTGLASCSMSLQQGIEESETNMPDASENGLTSAAPAACEEAD